MTSGIRESRHRSLHGYTSELKGGCIHEGDRIVNECSDEILHNINLCGLRFSPISFRNLMRRIRISDFFKSHGFFNMSFNISW